jgi:hypothetical protein
MSIDKKSLKVNVCLSYSFFGTWADETVKEKRLYYYKSDVELYDSTLKTVNAMYKEYSKYKKNKDLKRISYDIFVTDCTNVSIFRYSIFGAKEFYDYGFINKGNVQHDIKSDNCINYDKLSSIQLYLKTFFYTLGENYEN